MKGPPAAGHREASNMIRNTIQVRTPMAGTVKEILVQPGERVIIDSVLLVLAAGRIEVPIRAREPGMVTELKVNLGDAVSEDQLLLVLD